MARRFGFGWLVLSLAALSVRAEPAQPPVRSLAALPAAIRDQVNLGSARSADQIADSPFGTSSVVCFEGAIKAHEMADLIAAAGYKWVGEYMQADWSRKPTAEAERALWARPRSGCSEYLARLQGHRIDVLMRIDPLPTQKLIGKLPVTAEDLTLAKLYTRNAVALLKPFVKHWQIGNEPNVANAAEAYVKNLAVLAQVIREQQPDAVIYGPGAGMLQCLADEPYPWMKDALRAGMLKHIDVFSFHPYRANGDPPERASEFSRWRRWKNYAVQLDALNRTLQASGPRRRQRLAVTEDGEGSPISASGEQRVTPIIDAKHELRRSLLDFAHGIYPRLHFIFYRNIPSAAYSFEGSFNTVSSNLDKKPLYYAAQNLHAVLDNSYSATDELRVAVIDRTTRAAPEVGAEIQTYIKHHAGFDELLIFFWAPTFAQSMHLRVPICLQLSAADWEAPVLIDLMTMPGRAKVQGHESSEHERTTYPVIRRVQAGLLLDAVELRDYPQLLKLIRLTPAPR